jgi:hypothetical protein
MFGKLWLVVEAWKTLAGEHTLDKKCTARRQERSKSTSFPAITEESARPEPMWPWIPARHHRSFLPQKRKGKRPELLPPTERIARVTDHHILLVP